MEQGATEAAVCCARNKTLDHLRSVLILIWPARAQVGQEATAGRGVLEKTAEMGVAEVTATVGVRAGVEV